jgi:hypothetical protein
MKPSFTLSEWCKHRRVSRAMFYKLHAQGKAPRTHNNGIRRLISAEADADWLREREAETAHNTAQGLDDPARNGEAA